MPEAERRWNLFSFCTTSDLRSGLGQEVSDGRHEGLKAQWPRELQSLLQEGDGSLEIPLTRAEDAPDADGVRERGGVVPRARDIDGLARQTRSLAEAPQLGQRLRSPATGDHLERRCTPPQVRPRTNGQVCEATGVG